MSLAQRIIASLAAFLGDFIGEPLRQAAEEQRQFLSSPEGRRTDWEVIAILVSVSALLTARHYCFPSTPPGWLDDAVALIPAGGLRQTGEQALLGPRNHQLIGLVRWSLGQTVCFLVAPVFIVKLWFRRRLADFGAKSSGVFACWWVYAAMYAGLLPLVLLASQRESFLETYPFYRLPEGESLWPRFWIWQACYAMQFASLEFFFRGYILHGCRRRFGAYSILVMTIPYCMIHFGKPIPETLGAIVAGLLLGFMSLKTRSIWMGAALHVAVAMTMDGAAMNGG
jgi:uncharacterized protein